MFARNFHRRRRSDKALEAEPVAENKGTSNFDPFDLFAAVFGGPFREVLQEGLSQSGKDKEVQAEPEISEPALAPEAQLDLKLQHVQVQRLDSIKAAPENDDVYHTIAWDDPELHELARSIKERGVQEPILISRDGYIISGHRRRMAAHIAELELVPVRVHPVSRAENRDEFLKLLVEMNSQRIKSAAELLHESVIKVDPKDAHQQIVNQRKEKDRERSWFNSLDVIDPRARRRSM